MSHSEALSFAEQCRAMDETMSVPAPVRNVLVQRYVEVQNLKDDHAIDRAISEWMPKIDANEVFTHIDTDSDATWAFDKAHSLDNAQAIGEVYMAVKRNYATRLAYRELELDDRALVPDGAAAIQAITKWLIAHHQRKLEGKA